MKIAVIAEYNEQSETHRATSRALDLELSRTGFPLTYEWVGCGRLESLPLEDVAGFFIGTGGPTRCLGATLEVVRTAREEGIPLLGTCGGFQNVILETARNILGYKNAAHEEADPTSPVLFITKLECSLYGRTMELSFVENSRVAKLYNGLSATEHYYCSFGVNPEYVNELGLSGLAISGSDAEGIVRVIEYSTHPFFIATLFVPQVRCTVGHSHPLIAGFVEACMVNRDERMR